MITNTVKGCLDSTAEAVRISAFIISFAPNAFTSNGGWINDDFMFKSYGVGRKNLGCDI